MILICYDGSADAKAAVEEAARLFPQQRATVLTVWEPFAEVIARTAIGFGLVPSLPDAGEVDQASMKAAEDTAAEGAKLAGEHGLSADSKSTSQWGTTARALLSAADELGADAIVMGSRGLSGLKSLLLGSVSHELVQRADRTVVIVPSSKVAASRAREAQEQTAA